MKKGSTSRLRRCRCCRSWSPPSPRAPRLFGDARRVRLQGPQRRQGDLAAEKAVSLAPASQRARLKKELAELKKSAASSTTTIDGTITQATSGAARRRSAATGAAVEQRIWQRHDHRRRQELQSQPEGQGRARKQQKEIAARFVAGAFSGNRADAHPFRIGRAGLESRLTRPTRPVPSRAVSSTGRAGAS